MKIQKLNTSGFSHLLIPLLAVVAVASVGTYTAVASHANSIHGAARFRGVITQDECATTKLPVGDVGCSITVDHKVVYVAHGNIRQTQPWGKVIGFSSLKTNYTGKKVEVYAAKTTNHAYTLQGSTEYYVKLLPAKQQHFKFGSVKGSIYLLSSNGANCGNSCPASTPQPYRAVVAVQTTDGKAVSSFVSKSNGSFSVRLREGTYVLVPRSYSSGNLHAPNQTIKVSPDVTTNVTINYASNIPAAVPNPAPTPGPTTGSTLKHPGPTDCAASHNLTVYASLPNGTPAYSYDQVNKKVLRTEPYGTAITGVYCNDSGTLLYHYDGNNVYSTYNPGDVSLTKP